MDPQSEVCETSSKARATASRSAASVTAIGEAKQNVRATRLFANHAFVCCQLTGGPAHLLSGATVAVLLAVLAIANASWFSQGDQARLSGLLSSVHDLQSAYYAAIGLKALNADIPSVCLCFLLLV